MWELELWGCVAFENISSPSCYHHSLHVILQSASLSMGYRRFRQPLPFVARRSLFVAGRSSLVACDLESPLCVITLLSYPFEHCFGCHHNPPLEKRHDQPLVVDRATRLRVTDCGRRYSHVAREFFTLLTLITYLPVCKLFFVPSRSRLEQRNEQPLTGLPSKRTSGDGWRTSLVARDLEIPLCLLTLITS